MSLVCTRSPQELTADASPAGQEKGPTAVEFHYDQSDSFAPLLRQQTHGIHCQGADLQGSRNRFAELRRRIFFH